MPYIQDIRRINGKIQDREATAAFPSTTNEQLKLRWIVVLKKKQK